jgi:ABC-type polysaccharide/polyol phosphate export permease
MVAFYVTPILYPEELVPAAARPLLAVNPLRDVIALFRAALFGTAVPPWRRLGIETAAFIVLGFAGRQFYRRLRPAFADVL